MIDKIKNFFKFKGFKLKIVKSWFSNKYYCIKYSTNNGWSWKTICQKSIITNDNGYYYLEIKYFEYLEINNYLLAKFDNINKINEFLTKEKYSVDLENNIIKEKNNNIHRVQKFVRNFNNSQK